MTVHGSGYQGIGPPRSSLSLSISSLHHLEQVHQVHLLLGALASNADSISHHNGMPHTGAPGKCTTGLRTSTSGSFVDESFNLAHFYTTTSVIRCCSVAVSAGNFGDGRGMEASLRRAGF